MSTVQMFTREHIIPQLVIWFNSLPDAQRIIRPADIPLFNIKAIQDPAEPELFRVVIGDQSNNVDSSLLLGEATFTWMGDRHTTLPRTATSASFYEVSRDVSPLVVQDALVVHNADADAHPALSAFISDQVTRAALSATSAADSAAIVTGAATSLILSWAYVQNFRIVNATRDANGVILRTDINWPDGTSGQFIATSISLEFPGAIDAWSATYEGTTTKVITQPPVTRDSNGAVISQPPITVI